MGLCLGVKAFLLYTLSFPRCVGVGGVYRHQDSDSDSRGWWWCTDMISRNRHCGSFFFANILL